jgi:hypothetical protein
MAPCDVGYGAHGRQVVGINSGENVESAVLDGGEVAFQHLLDDAVLMPEGDEDGDGALGFPAERDFVRPGKAATAGEQAYQRDEEVVQSADQDPGRNGNQTDQDPVVQPVEWDVRKGSSTAGGRNFSGK